MLQVAKRHSSYEQRLADEQHDNRTRTSGPTGHASTRLGGGKANRSYETVYEQATEANTTESLSVLRPLGRLGEARANPGGIAGLLAGRGVAGIVRNCVVSSSLLCYGH